MPAWTSVAASSSSESQCIGVSFNLSTASVHAKRQPGTMNQGEGSGLPPAGQSYPSPTPQQMGVGGLPYYGNQHQLSPEEAQLQQQLSGAVRSTMAEGMNNGQNMMGPGGEYGDQT